MAHRRARAAFVLALLFLALGGALACLGYFAWRGQPSIARALLFGVPPLLLLVLGVVTAVDGILAPRGEEVRECRGRPTR